MSDLITGLSSLLASWDLAGLLTDWDGDQGYRRQYTHGMCGGDPWISVSGDGPAGLVWHGMDRVEHRATWPQVRAVLAGIPAPLVAELSEAVEALRAVVGVEMSKTALWRREEAALAACWASLRTDDEPKQLDLFDLLVGAR